MSKQIRKQVIKVEETLFPHKARKLKDRLLSLTASKAVSEVARLDNKDSLLFNDLLNVLSEIDLKQIDDHIGKFFSFNYEIPKSKKELRIFLIMCQSFFYSIFTDFLADEIHRICDFRQSIKTYIFFKDNSFEDSRIIILISGKDKENYEVSKSEYEKLKVELLEKESQLKEFENNLQEIVERGSFIEVVNTVCALKIKK